MTEAGILDRARQGDVDAIVSLMNQSLVDTGVTAKAALKAQCLQVMLEGEDVPDQSAYGTFVKTGITNLGIETIAALKVYGRQVGQNIPAWTEEFQLRAAAALAEAPPEISPTPAPAQEAAPPSPPTPAESAAPPSPEQGGKKKRPPGVKDLAKQGDIAALTTLVNRTVSQKDIKARSVTLYDGCLEISLEAQQTPDKSVVGVLVHRELSYLESSLIQSVKIFGYKASSQESDWMEEFAAQPSSGAHGSGVEFVHPSKLRPPEPVVEEIDEPNLSDSSSATSSRSHSANHSSRMASPGSRSVSSSLVQDASVTRQAHPNRQVLSILCHASALLGGWFFWLPLILMITSSDRVVQINAQEAWRLQLSLLIWGCSAWLIAGFVPFFGFIIFIISACLITLIAWILPIMAIVKVAQNPDEPALYPLVHRL